MPPIRRRFLCPLLALLLLIPGSSMATASPGEDDPLPELTASVPDLPDAEPDTPEPEPEPEPTPIAMTGAAWELAGLGMFQARLGPLPDYMAVGSDPVPAGEFARLCAQALGEEEERFLSLLPEDADVLTREQAVVVAASAVASPLRTPLTYADAGDIHPDAVDSVEKLLRCGVLSAGNSNFMPQAPMTNACAAILITRLMDVDRAAPAVELTAMSFVGGKSLSRAQKDLLVSYGTRTLDALARLDPDDLSDLFDPSNQAAGAELDNAIHALQCRRWARSPVDLTAGEVSFQYTCTKVRTLKNGRVQVSLQESCSFDFRGVEGISEAPLTEHVFTLSKAADGTWRIWAHEWNDRGYDRLSQALEEGLDLEEYSREMVRLADEALLAREDTRGQAAASLTAKHPYDRQAACEYAATYIATRNPDYRDYSQNGGNCQNFVSQCLQAGGLPTNNGWKPGLATWSAVRYFSLYIQKDNRAPVAQWDAPFYTAQPGDVVHCRFSTDALPKHAMFITGTVLDGEGKVVDYVVSSNTCNWKNFPLSAHWYDTFLIIKIHGWK